MTVGIIANSRKAGARETLCELSDLLEAKGISVLLEKDTANALDVGRGVIADVLSRECDIVAVLGGDGTMLDAVQRLGPTQAAVAGINIGNLGFLTSCREGELSVLVDAIVSETYHVVPRILLQATVISPNGKSNNYFAVNEITLTRGQTGRLVALDAFIDGDLLNHYNADGLIVATPTGSTAYSLAAGGPLLSPIAQNFVITPICPHSLTNRSLVLTDSSVVELISADNSENPTLFTVDGQCMVELEHGSKIRVEKADHQLKLIRLEGRSFFSTLRQKLRWG